MQRNSIHIHRDLVPDEFIYLSPRREVLALMKRINTKKIILRVSLLIVISLGILSALLYYTITPKLVQSLEELVEEETNGAYSLQIENASFSIIQLKAKVNGIELIPNATFFDTTLSFQSYLNVKFDALELGLGNVFGVIFDQEINIRKLTIDKPQLTFYKLARLDSISSPPKQDSTLQQASKLGALFINDFLLTNGTIDLYEIGKDTLLLAHTDRISMKLDAFEFNKALYHFIYFEHFNLKMENFIAYLHDEYLQFKAEKATFNSSEHNFIAETIQLTPTISKEEYAQTKGFQQDFPELQCKTLRIDGISYLDLAFSKHVKAQKITIDSAQLNLYRDFALNYLPKRKKRLPNTFLKETQLAIDIDSIEVKQMDVHIADRGKKTREIATIDIQQINGLITNITNDSLRVQKHPNMLVNASGILATTAQVKINAAFELNHSNDAFNVKGKVQHLNLPNMNTIVEPLAQVKFTSGEVEQLTFNMHADNAYANGNVTFNVDNPHLELGNAVKSMKFKDRVIRNVAVFAGNTALSLKGTLNDPTPMKGNISHYRDPEKTVFAYVLRSVLSGMLSGLGVKNNEDKAQQRNN